VLALAFPPVRAELVTTGKVGEMQPRLRNLATPANAVTWYGDGAGAAAPLARAAAGLAQP
jgi:hypothetical protein